MPKVKAGLTCFDNGSSYELVVDGYSVGVYAAAPGPGMRRDDYLSMCRILLALEDVAEVELDMPGAFTVVISDLAHAAQVISWKPSCMGRVHVELQTS